MSWSSLPLDMVELILGHLSLVDVAQISRTSRTFQAMYRARMLLEQKARCELAIKSCGRKRILCVLGIFQHLLKGDSLCPEFVDNKWNHFWICAQGVLHALDPLSSAKSSRSSIRKDVGLEVWVCPGGYGLRRASAKSKCRDEQKIVVRVFPGWSQLSMNIDHTPMRSVIDVRTRGDDDVVPVALLQALLSEGLALCMHDAGQHVEVRIRPDFDFCEVTQVGLKAQIAPLMPFAPHGTPLHDVPRRNGKKGKRKGYGCVEPSVCMHLGQLGVQRQQ